MVLYLYFISGSKLSVFQKKKAATPKTLKSPKTPKIPKTPKPPKAERIKEKKPPKSDKPKGKPGRPKGVKNKDKKIVAPQTISKEYLSSSDSDSSPETPKKQKSEKPSGSHKRDRPDVPATAAPPPAKKVNITPYYMQFLRWSVKFIYSEKAAKFCEISTLLLTGTTQDKSKVEISQNCVTFLE